MKIKVCYFSPTGTTREVAERLAEQLGEKLNAAVETRPYTLPRQRETLPQFDPDDLLLWATPVYAGRIPNKTLDYVRRVFRERQKELEGLPAVSLVTFGNRAYDNALAELTGLMQEAGMRVVGAAAMVTRHSFSDTLGAGRPNAEDWQAMSTFVSQVAERVTTGKWLEIQVPGEAHPEQYYTPLKTNSAPAGFLKAKPSCAATLCSHCGRCAEVCPMGSIVMQADLPQFAGICIKCQACRRICPAGAIAFTDPEYCSHVAMIEQTFAAPQRAEFFV